MKAKSLEAFRKKQTNKQQQQQQKTPKTNKPPPQNQQQQQQTPQNKQTNKQTNPTQIYCYRTATGCIYREKSEILIRNSLRLLLQFHPLDQEQNWCSYFLLKFILHCMIHVGA